MQVLIPYVQHGEPRTERCVVRRAPNGRTARLLTIPREVHGVSIHDLVRFDSVRDGRPAHATAVVARSPLLTVHLVGPAAGVADLRGRLAPVIQHPGAASELEAGRLAVAVAPHLFGSVLELAAAGAPGIRRDDRGRRAGAWHWTIRSRPTWPTPLALPADPAEVASADEVATWTPDDPIGRTWDARFVAELRQRAAVDRDVREALRTGRYLVAVVPVLRDVLARTYGPTRAGGRTFPLGAADPEAAHRAWQAAHDTEGRVRWAPDRHVDRDLRAMLAALGLDPDADPARSVTGPSPATPSSTAPPSVDTHGATPRHDLVGGGQA